VVISTSANDDFEFKQKWGVDKSQQEKIVDSFKIKFRITIIVTAVIPGLTPILSMYRQINKRSYFTQAIRTNRLTW
jgi:type I restriction enzyme R subunit